MKSCPRCGREFADTTTLCPADGTVLEKSGDELVGQMLTDRYRIDERISEGGMGTVYRATHVLMDKRVAIKVLHPSLAADDKIVARFSREARAASRISHPHALNVTDFGESESGVVFLVMEFLDGKTLKEVIQANGPLPLARVVEIIKQVAGALDAAHKEGVVHRDLKSDNIMLIEAQNGSDWAKVLDFGIAKIKEPMGATDPGLTAPNLIIGTPQYMSPEQCSQASEIDSRSDIYSLGIIIFEMLTGHVPFTGDSPTAIMMKQLQEPPPSVLEERDDLSPQVSMVVTSALAKRPEDRFQSAGELSQALAAAADGEIMQQAATAAATSPGASSETGRIIVPTGSNEAPRNTREEDLDEATVISARPAATATGAYETSRIESPPPPQEKSNPWRIIIPTLAGILVLFGVIYAITYKGNPAQPSANQAPGLTADPNSRPVQPAPPPTGKAEEGIAPSTNSNTSNSNASAGAPTGPESKPPENKNTEAGAPENANTANANRKERGQKNANNNQQGEQTDNPQPAEGNQDQGDQPPPPPKSNSNGDAPAEPKPKPKKVEPNVPSPPPTSNISLQEQQ